MSGGGAVFPLQDNQLKAVEPEDNVWLSASAGTGQDAGAFGACVTSACCARMGRAFADSVSDLYQGWRRRRWPTASTLCWRVGRGLPATVLAKELGHLGADIDPATQSRARSLFASVLDCPGGGFSRNRYDPRLRAIPESAISPRKRGSCPARG